MHSITTENNASNLLDSTRSTIATLMACGLNPDKCILYNQSRVPGHAELMWLLLCMTPMGELKTMTQFKEKSASKAIPLTGLFSYPVLMAADILLYKATHVPVGDDQVQHLELARRLADKFNRTFGEPAGVPEYFPIPQILHTTSRRVMSLRDAKKKMSKSDPAEYSRINLSDPPETVALKIQKAKTDSILGITYDIEERPELANLIDIYSAFSGLNPQEIVQVHQNHDILTFKRSLTDAIIPVLGPISSDYLKYKDDPKLIDHVLDMGSKKANEQAAQTMIEVRKLVGYS